MDRALLDTDALSEVIKAKHANVVRHAQAYRIEHGCYTTSTIVLVEIIKGFQRVRREDRIRSVLTALTGEELLTVDLAAAEIAGRIYGDLERTGQPIGRADPLIAGIAIRHGLVLVTGNTEHYQRVQKLGYGLRLADWRQPE